MRRHGVSKELQGNSRSWGRGIWVGVGGCGDKLISSSSVQGTMLNTLEAPKKVCCVVSSLGVLSLGEGGGRMGQELLTRGLGRGTLTQCIPVIGREHAQNWGQSACKLWNSDAPQQSQEPTSFAGPSEEGRQTRSGN